MPNTTLHLVGRQYWHGDFVAVEEKCLVCKEETIGAWELQFRWGGEVQGDKYENIREVCWKCYERVWQLCDNTRNLPFADYSERPLPKL